jgi:hypothetical protein
MLLAVVAAALVVPVCTTFAKSPKVLVDEAAMARACDVFPGSKYDNIWQLPVGAEGDVQVWQASDKKVASFVGTVGGATPGTVYNVYFDMNGITAGDVSTAGPWQFIIPIVQFTTDESGDGAWSANISAGTIWPVGTHTISVFINPIAPNATQLISDNVTFYLTK